MCVRVLAYSRLVNCYVLCVWSAVDVVVRAHFYKYFHPKEALVSNGVLNRY